jgi:hypothetical protein
MSLDGIKSTIKGKTMTNGQSKKVFVGIIAMQQIASMADDPTKFPFAIVIAVIGIAYMVKQAFLDWKADKEIK